MSDPNLIRVCRLPSDLGVAAGRDLFLDPARLTFLIGSPPGPGDTNGAAGRPESLAEFLAARPELHVSVREFLVGRMTGHPKAFEEENREELTRMLAEVTPENRHGEVDWGPPVGREVW